MSVAERSSFGTADFWVTARGDEIKLGATLAAAGRVKALELLDSCCSVYRDFDVDSPDVCDCCGCCDGSLYLDSDGMRPGAVRGDSCECCDCCGCCEVSRNGDARNDDDSTCLLEYVVKSVCDMC